MRKRTRSSCDSVDDGAAGGSGCEGPPERARTEAAAPPLPSLHAKKRRLRYRQFDCTVHGKIELHPTLVCIIDTPQVRLPAQEQRREHDFPLEVARR